MPPSLLGTMALALLAAGISGAAAHPQHHEHQALQHTSEAEAFFERCGQQQQQPDQLNWVKYYKACYRWFETPQYWYVAEKACQALGGNLMSVADQRENNFLAKLTYCQAAWIGRFAIDADRTTDRSNYRWTDSTTGQYYTPHNIIDAQLHFPLLYSKNSSWINDVYHKMHTYVCKVPSVQRNYTCNCETGWKEFNGYCYYMPTFEATYIEGDYFCRGWDAHLASLHSDAELRAMSLLNVDTEGCPAETWIGLVKLNPCFEGSSNRTSVCYRWSDRSGAYDETKSPKWLPNHPINDLKTNCVLLKDREIQTVPCYTRARFVCKKKTSKTVN